MSKTLKNIRCVKRETHPMPRDPDCYLRRSSVNNLISGRVNKLNTQLIESIPDIANMRRTLDTGANPNATCRLNNVSACHIAAMHENDALDLLIRSGADISRSDKHGRTPLHFAAWAGHAKQIALLLDFPEALIRSVIGVALSPETVEEVKRLSHPVNKLTNIPCQLNVESALPDEWSDGMEHNCRNFKEILPLFQQGWTALHYASARAQQHCVQLLLTAGADESAQDLLCRTPLDVAGCAHYIGHNIDENNFMETIDLLLNAGGKFLKYRDESNPSETPLHTAVELESEAAVEQMLRAGASATAWNSEGLTSMHICVKKRNKELLQILANHKCSNENPDLTVVDVKDRKGSTVLCAAVKAEWTDGVCVALGAGASIIMQSNGESPIHIATQLGNTDILQGILAVAKYNSTIDYRDEKGETALFKAISCNYLDVLLLLLKNGASIDVNNSEKANVFHVAAKHGRKEILEHLLKHESQITEKLINMSDYVGPPLFYAIINNNSVCAALLISKGARVDAKCYDSSTPLLHVAARKNRYVIAKIITKHDSDTIHGLDFRGWTPLHVACHCGNKEMIELLLREGADLSGALNGNKSDTAKQTKRIPIKMLMNNVTKPTDFLQEIFDSYITIKHYDCNWDITVDYKVLAPKSAMKQMEVLMALINTGSRYGQDKLLLHPLVQSFLYLRWSSLLPFFYSILALHVCCTLSLNVFALSLFWYKDRKIEPVPSIFRNSAWIYVIYLTACLILIQEIIFTATQSKRILLCIETWLKFLSITLAIILPLVVSWNSESIPELVRLLVSTTLIFTWAKMIFLVSRFPEFGYYVLMYGKVANKVFKILSLFLFVIFGFSISFMIQFHAQPPFEDPWSSLLTTMVMMTSEFNYKDTMNNESAANASLIMLRIIFLTFLILVSIVLMNLLIGVAVNDVNNLEIVGNKERLKKQVEFITSFEDAGCNSYIKKVFPTSLFKIWYENIKWKDSFVMRSNSHDYDAFSPDCHLPVRLREAIYEKAQLRKKQSDDEQGTMLYQMKLDEMYKVIVRTDSGESTKPARLDHAMNKIFEEIIKIRKEIALSKKNKCSSRSHKRRSHVSRHYTARF